MPKYTIYKDVHDILIKQSLTAAQQAKMINDLPFTSYKTFEAIVDRLSITSVTEFKDLIFDYAYPVRNDSDKYFISGGGLFSIISAAIENGYYNTIEVLANTLQAIPTPASYAYNAPLTHFAKVGTTNQVRTLLEYKADVNAKSQEQDSPLIAASKSGNIDIMQLLIENKASINYTKALYKGSPIEHAVKSNQLAAVKLLIDAKADLLTPNMYGQLITKYTPNDCYYNDEEKKIMFHMYCGGANKEEYLQTAETIRALIQSAVAKQKADLAGPASAVICSIVELGGSEVSVESCPEVTPESAFSSAATERDVLLIADQPQPSTLE